MTYRRFLRPYFVATAFLAIVFIVLNTYIIPLSDKHRFVFEEKYIRNRKTVETQNIREQIEPGTMLEIQSFNFLDSVGYNLSMERFENNKIAKRIFATRLYWNKETNKWTLENYRERIFNGSSQLLIKLPSKDTTLPINPNEFVVKNEFISTMTNPELNEYIRKEKIKGSSRVSSFYVELYKRVASPFSFFVLTLLAVGVSSRKSRGGTGIHLGIGIFITFAFLLSTQVSNTFGISGIIHPAIAVWVSNVVFLIVGLVVAAKSPK
jgi:lipopolysaccharide export system permease protein